MQNFGESRPDGSPGPSKPELRRMIEDAMANTVALQQGRPLVSPKPVRATPVPSVQKNAPAAPVEASTHVSQETKAFPPPRAEPSTAKATSFYANPIQAIPTADHVGRAIVAACRETEACPLGIDGGLDKRIVQARHYAMHAIAHCFPGLPAATYGRCVGAIGKPDRFYSRSKQATIRMVAPHRRAAAWWSEEAYARVIEAIRP